MKTNEIWKAIEGYEGLYEVSNLGNVKSLRSGIILKQQKNADGYCHVSLCRKKEVKTVLIHRLVAKAFLSNPENYNEVNHKDENKANNCVENLEWCSHKYNLNYGSYRDKMSKAQTGKKRPRTSKIEVQKNDSLANLRRQLAANPQKPNEFDKWSEWLENAVMEIDLI